jgi:hypothetical protein
VAFNGHWRIPRGTVLLALLAVTALMVPATKAADPPTLQAPRSYTIPGRGVLELDVPVTWKSSMDQPPDGRPPTITFSFFFRTKDTPEREAVLAMLAGARVKTEAATAFFSAAPAPLSLSLPGYAWGVHLDLAGFAITADEMNSARTARRIAAENHESSITLSAFLERVPEPMDAKACRTY